MHNIILIGMAGAGKSTIGREIAAIMNRPWIDTDKLIADKINQPLAAFIKEHGVDAFKKVEEEVLLKLNVSNSIISTGGSAIYSGDGMEHLESTGVIVYLEVDFETIEKRISRNPDRGIATDGNETLFDIYTSRLPIYKFWADITVPCSNNSINKTIEDITFHLTFF